jgi:hypothetical protein
MGSAFVLGILVGRILSDIAEWLRRATEDNLEFARGYLAGVESSKADTEGK